MGSLLAVSAAHDIEQVRNLLSSQLSLLLST